MTNLKEIITTGCANDVFLDLEVGERDTDIVTHGYLYEPGTVTVVGVTVWEIRALNNPLTGI